MIVMTTKGISKGFLIFVDETTMLCSTLLCTWLMRRLKLPLHFLQLTIK